MTKDQISKFIEEYQLEWHWFRDPEFTEVKKNEVILFVPFELIEEFADMIGALNYSEKDDGIVRLRECSIAVEMRKILEENDIYLEDIFKQ